MKGRNSEIEIFYLLNKEGNKNENIHGKSQ